MALLIDSGPIEATDLLSGVAKERWSDLLRLRRRYVKIKLDHDCRCLVQFVADAEVMFAPLGYANSDDLIRDGLGLISDEIRIAARWLEINHPDKPMPHNVVLRLAHQFAADPNVTPAAAHGTNQHSGGVAIGHSNKLSSNSAERIVRRLKRDHPEIAEALARGEYRSARAAGMAAGFVKRRRCPHCGHEL